MDGWTDGRQKVITIAHLEYISGELIKHTCTQREIHLKWIPDFTPEIAKNRGKLGYKR